MLGTFPGSCDARIISERGIKRQEEGKWDEFSLLFIVWAWACTLYTHPVEIQIKQALQQGLGSCLAYRALILPYCLNVIRYLG